MLTFNYSLVFFLFNQRTAYEMRISDWSSDVCSSDLSLVRLMSSVSRHGRRCAQSIPVDGLRCTLSIKIDHSTIGTPQASTLAIAEFGPLIGPREPQSMPRKAAISGAKRAMSK